MQSRYARLVTALLGCEELDEIKGESDNPNQNDNYQRRATLNDISYSPADPFPWDFLDDIRREPVALDDAVPAAGNARKVTVETRQSPVKAHIFL